MVWNYDDMCTERTLQGFHRRAVTLVKFSPDGRHLATVGADDHHRLVVYDWENSIVLSFNRCELNPGLVPLVGLSSSHSCILSSM